REGRRFCGDCGLSLALPCPSCGFVNEGSVKFCGGCGSPRVEAGAAPRPRFGAPTSCTPKHLAEKSLSSQAVQEGERKTVTVMFADLKGSMELLADRDPEEARGFLDPVLERMMEAVHRYEGTVNQVMGDGIMALFGAPLAHEDHAVRACYAALRMQDSVARYAEDLRRLPGARPHALRRARRGGRSAPRGARASRGRPRPDRSRGGGAGGRQVATLLRIHALPSDAGLARARVKLGVVRQGDPVPSPDRVS